MAVGCPHRTSYNREVGHSKALGSICHVVSVPSLSWGAPDCLQIATCRNVGHRPHGICMRTRCVFSCGAQWWCRCSKSVRLCCPTVLQGTPWLQVDVWGTYTSLSFPGIARAKASRQRWWMVESDRLYAPQHSGKVIFLFCIWSVRLTLLTSAVSSTNAVLTAIGFTMLNRTWANACYSPSTG
jgi:hypothetical protein